MNAKHLKIYNTVLSVVFLVIASAVVYQLGIAWLSQ